MGTITQTIFDVVCIGGCVICASLYFMRKMHKMKRHSHEKADGEEVEVGD